MTISQNIYIRMCCFTLKKGESCTNDSRNLIPREKELKSFYTILVNLVIKYTKK